MLPKIVLVEDNEGHILLIKRNLRRNLKTNIIVFKDFCSAQIYFEKLGNLDEKVIVILDLNLNGVSATNLIFQIKNNDSTKAIPIIVLSSSDSPNDINLCYKNGCNLFFTKPIDYEEFQETLNTISRLILKLKL